MKVFRNICTNIFLQILLIFSGLLIPRFIMTFYGSEMNGLVSSISQFIAYAALLEMGIGNASIIALYKPIAENNITGIGSILTSSKKMYRRSGYIYLLVLLLIAITYPLLLIRQFEYIFTFMMVLCIGSINVIDYFILGKYKVLLIADQKYYILNVAKMIDTIILTIGSMLLLYSNVSVLWIKTFAVVTRLWEALFIYIYIKIKYSYVNYHSKNIIKIEQRWNALICQVCSTIVYNTDLVVLTLCLPEHNLSEISVYTVYNMIFSLLVNLGSSLTTGINASFGNLLAKKENEKMFNFFELYELLYFIVLFTICSCYAALIVPFVACYTKGINDACYIRYEIGLLFAVNGLSAQIKDISGMVAMAAGKIKEIQGYAIEEAVVNIIISVLLVRKYGIVGVLVGTLISHILMSMHMINYAAKELIHGTKYRTYRRILRNLIVAIFLVVLELFFVENTMKWTTWVLQTTVITIINGTIIMAINYLCEPELTTNIVVILKRRINNVLRRTI